MTTVDWSQWMSLSPAEQDTLRKIYLDTIAAERDANIRRWNAMSYAEQARYPEVGTNTGGNPGTTSTR